MNLGIKPIVAGQLQQATNKNQSKNTIQNYQGTIPRLQTPKYDTVSFCAFGEAPVIYTEKDFSYGDNFSAKSITANDIELGSNAKIEDTIRCRSLYARAGLKTEIINAGDDVTLGSNAEVKDYIATDGNLNTGDGLKTKKIIAEWNVKLGSNTEVKDAIRCRILEAGDGLKTEIISAKGDVKLGSNTEVKDTIKCRSLEAQNGVKTNHLEVFYDATLGSNAEVGYAIKCSNLNAGDGLKTKFIVAERDVKLGSNTEVKDEIKVGGKLIVGNEFKTKDIISYGDVELNSINTLETIYLHANKDEKLKSKHLTFNSSEIIPEKIKVILGDLTSLVIKIGGDQKDEIFKKLEFYYLDNKAINKIGAKVSKEIIAQAIKVL